MSVVILGGGIAGLLAAYAFRESNPVLLEGSSRLGGMFTAGGLKYIHRTPDMERLLTELDVPFQPYEPRGKLLHGEHLVQHPEAMKVMTPLARYHIQLKHWMKTRGSDYGMREDCMNDPLGAHSALRCDHSLLIERLANAVQHAGVNIRLGCLVQAITRDEIVVKEGASEATWRYTRLLPTISLSFLRTLAGWANLPKAETTKLVLAKFTTQVNDPRWDYAYTPSLTRVSRVVWEGPGSISAEVPAHLIPIPWTSNLPPGEAMVIAAEVARVVNQPVMPNGHVNIPGHLRPLLDPLTWPHNWFALGRFAQWEPRATADHVYSRALSLAASIGT